MEVTMTETDSDKPNKRTFTARCEKDDAELDEAMQLIVRCLNAYGYKTEHVAEWFIAFGQQAVARREAMEAAKAQMNE